MMTRPDSDTNTAAWLLVCITERAPAFEPSTSTAPEVVATLDGLHLVGVPLERAGAASRPSREQLDAYKRVIETCFAQTTTLPLRFGTMVTEAQRASEVLEDGRSGFRAALERAQGCVEMGVRVEAAPRPSDQAVRRPTEAASGAEYLAARSAQLERNEPRVPAQLKNLLRESITDSNATRSDAPVGDFDGPSVCYNFLVRREQLGAFRQGIDAWRPMDRRIVISGPWPPFSFTGSKP